MSVCPQEQQGDSEELLEHSACPGMRRLPVDRKGKDVLGGGTGVSVLGTAVHSSRFLLAEPVSHWTHWADAHASKAAMMSPS